MVNFLEVLFKYRFFGFQNFLEELQAKKMMIVKLYHNQDQLQLMSGLVLGQKNPQAVYINDFANAGMLHVLVASGFNISLVAGLAWWLTQKLASNSRFLLVLGSIWSYTAFLEWQPPLLRAAWMFSLVFVLKHQGIKTKKSRILIFSLALIIGFQPGLLSSLSLWLSALATLGILTFAQRLSLFWREDSLELRAVNKGFVSRLKDVFLEEAATSFAAQSLIFPLLVLVFHSINLVSFLANPLLLPGLGAMTQLAAGEFLLSFLDQFWLGRVLLWGISRVMAIIFDLYFAAVAWWQHFFFLNFTPLESGFFSGRSVAFFWFNMVGLYWGLTRIKQERKNHFLHEKV